MELELTKNIQYKTWLSSQVLYWIFFFNSKKRKKKQKNWLLGNQVLKS